MKASGHFQAQATLPHEKFVVPNDMEAGWVQGAGPNNLEKIKIICPYQEISQNTCHPHHSLVIVCTILSYIQFASLYYRQYHDWSLYIHSTKYKVCY